MQNTKNALHRKPILQVCAVMELQSLRCFGKWLITQSYKLEEKATNAWKQASSLHVQNYHIAATNSEALLGKCLYMCT